MVSFFPDFAFQNAVKVVFPLALRGVERWINRMAWTVNAYVDCRTKTIDSGMNDASVEMEVKLKENYNYFVRMVRFALK